MTSEGSSRVVPSYGVVSSAKAALESHVRQLAMELARLGHRRDGERDPRRRHDDAGADEDPREGRDHRGRDRRNPTGRMTTTQDVAERDPRAVGEGAEFISGEVIGVDGGEFVTGS